MLKLKSCQSKSPTFLLFTSESFTVNHHVMLQPAAKDKQKIYIYIYLNLVNNSLFEFCTVVSHMNHFKGKKKLQ